MNEHDALHMAEFLKDQSAVEIARHLIRVFASGMDYQRNNPELTANDAHIMRTLSYRLREDGECAGRDRFR